MGACGIIIGFGDNIKTPQQALKDANDRGEQDRYENGHSYSGTMGMLHWRYVERTYDTVEDFEKTFKEKDDGVIARVKVIRETKPLLKARQEFFNIDYEVERRGPEGKWHRNGEKPLTPAQYKRLLEKHGKARAKYRKLLDAQLAKSTKTRFIGGGWASS